MGGREAVEHELQRRLDASGSAVIATAALVGRSDEAADAEGAARLWAVSEDLTGVRFSPPSREAAR